MVDRAGAYGTPTCVFHVNNSEGFVVGPPNIDLNKSRSCLPWLCSTHACWCALAPANLPMKELSGLYCRYPWNCNSGQDCCQDVAMWIACVYNAYIWCGCFMFALWFAYEFVIAQLCFSQSAYCRGNLPFYNLRFWRMDMNCSNIHSSSVLH